MSLIYCGNPAVVMQDECHCDNPVVPETEMTNEVAQTGGNNPYNFMTILKQVKKNIYLIKKVKSLLKS